MSFTFSTMFPIAIDKTEYELLEKDHVHLETFQNKNFLLIQPEALKIITENINKEKKLSSNKSNEDKKQKFNAEIFSLDAFRAKKED